MMHHGIPTYELLQAIDSKRYNTLVKEFDTRVTALHKFLKKLLSVCDGTTISESSSNATASSNNDAIRYFRDSYIILTADKEQPRQLNTEPGHFPTFNTMKGIRESLTSLTSSHGHVHRTLVKAESPPITLDNVWGVRRATPTTEVLEKRVASILMLKQAISTGAEFARKDASQVDGLKRAALVAVLSVFRRPLSIPVVRSLTERWFLPEKGHLPASVPAPDLIETVHGAHDRVDNLLRSLQKERYVVIHQGGRIRLERSIYELFYGGLTSDLHVGSVILKWKERYASDASRRACVIVQGALAASLHFAAARTMYVDVFLLTHDVQAFYEYLYHRVAVLRILMVMCAMLRLPLTEELGRSSATVYDEVCAVLRRIQDQFKDLSQNSSKSGECSDVLHWFLYSVGLTSVINPNDEQSGAPFDLAYYIHRLRLHALQTLSLAIGRSERLLRSDASPDTLIGWARQFNQREESDISGKVFEAAHNAMPGELFGTDGSADAALKDLMLPEEALHAMITTVEFLIELQESHILPRWIFCRCWRQS